MNNLQVRRTEILTTDWVVFSVWEPTSGPCGEHSSLMSATDITGEPAPDRKDVKWYGRVGTRRLTPEIDALKPMSQERFDAVDAWHAAQYNEAYAAIIAAYPEAADGDKRMGEITIKTGVRNRP